MLLLSRVERHLKAGRIAPTRFGRDALRDPRLVFDLRAGRALRAPTERRLRAYLDTVEQRLDGRTT